MKAVGGDSITVVFPRELLPFLFQNQFHVPRSQAVFRDHDEQEKEQHRAKRREPLQKVIYHFLVIMVTTTNRDEKKTNFSFRSAHLPCSSIATASDVLFMPRGEK